MSFRFLPVMLVALFLSILSAFGEGKGIEQANKVWQSTSTTSGIINFVFAIGLFGLAAGGLYTISLFFYRMLGIESEAVQFLIWFCVISGLLIIRSGLYTNPLKLALYLVASVCLVLINVFP